MSTSRPWVNIVLFIFCSIFVRFVYAGCTQSEADSPTNAIAPACQQYQLSGKWSGVPGVLIPPKQISLSSHDYLDRVAKFIIPGYWDLNSLGISEKEPWAFISLWTEVSLSGELEEGERLALWPGRFQSAYRIYVDDGRGNIVKTYDTLSEFVPESGQPITELPQGRAAGKLMNGAHTQLPKLYPGAKVIIHLYNEDFRTGGASQPPLLGNADILYREMMQRWSWHILFLGACLLVAIYSASQALFSRSRRAMYAFSVVMSLGAGVRLLVTGSLLAYFVPGLTVVSHFYFTWISFLGLLAIFIYGQAHILPEVFESRPKLKTLSVALAVLPILLLLCIPLVDLHQFLLLGHGMRLLYIVLALLYVVFLIYHVIRFPFKQWIPFVGIMLILIGGTSDALYYRRNTDPYIELFAIAMFTFIAVQVMYVGWGYMKLLIREKGLSLRLQELNESLEQQVKSRTHDLQEANKRLALAATTDALTKLPNRRAFDSKIEQELDRAKRDHSELCLAIADADWFKKVNDKYGHDFGDRVLQKMAEFLSQRLRRTDFVARMGGEEFAIILPVTNLLAAQKLMAELCENIKQLKFEGQPDFTVGISIGVAQWQPKESFVGLYQRADKALYNAKHSGRGTVCVDKS